MTSTQQNRRFGKGWSRNREKGARIPRHLSTHEDVSCYVGDPFRYIWTLTSKAWTYTFLRHLEVRNGRTSSCSERKPFPKSNPKMLAKKLHLLLWLMRNTYTSCLRQHRLWNFQSDAMPDEAVLSWNQMSFHLHQHLHYLLLSWQHVLNCCSGTWMALKESGLAFS